MYVWFTLSVSVRIPPLWNKFFAFASNYHLKLPVITFLRGRHLYVSINYNCQCLYRRIWKTYWNSALHFFWWSLQSRGSTRDGTGVHDSIVNQLLTKVSAEAFSCIQKRIHSELIKVINLLDIIFFLDRWGWVSKQCSAYWDDQ